MLQHIPFPDLREVAHLSGQEVKTLFSYSVGREIEPSSRHNGYLVKALETFNKTLTFFLKEQSGRNYMDDYLSIV